MYSFTRVIRKHPVTKEKERQLLIIEHSDPICEELNNDKAVIQLDVLQMMDSDELIDIRQQVMALTEDIFAKTDNIRGIYRINCHKDTFADIGIIIPYFDVIASSKAEALKMAPKLMIHVKNGVNDIHFHDYIAK